MAIDLKVIDLAAVDGGPVDLAGVDIISFWLTPTDIPVAEAAALKAFYDATATGGAGWTDKTNWGTAAAADDYFGVTVVGGHVTAIALPNNGLTGNAGTTLDPLAAVLTSLDLGQNTGLTGITLSGMTALAAVDLAGCEFGQAVVSGILADLVTAGKSSGVLDIGGSNSAPEPTGVTALIALEDRSWTLTYSTVVMENTGAFLAATADGAAVIRNSVLDLSGQTTKYIVATDSAGKKAAGYGYQADSAEALGSELWEADAAAFASGIYSWMKYVNNVLSNDSNTLKIEYVDGGSGAYNAFRASGDLISDLTPGKLYTFAIDCKVSSGGNVAIMVADGATTFAQRTLTNTNFVTQTFLFNPISLTVVKFANFSTGESAWVDNPSIKENTALGTNALQIRNAATGTTRNWSLIETGFNPNTIAKVEVFNA